jgi:hypothetical protein
MVRNGVGRIHYLFGVKCQTRSLRKQLEKVGVP